MSKLPSPSLRVSSFLVTLSSLLLFSACSSIHDKDSKAYAVIEGDEAIHVHINSGKSISHCGATYLHSLSFRIHNNGEWHSSFKLLNNDQYYRPYWLNELSVDFYAPKPQGDTPLLSVPIYQKSMKAFKSLTEERAGQITIDTNTFSQLSQSTARIHHHCEGQTEENNNYST